MTRFEVGDLLKRPAGRRRYDLILCRNTVIYFAEPIRDELHGRLADAPAARRLPGHRRHRARRRRRRELGLEPIHPFIYRKA